MISSTAQAIATGTAVHTMKNSVGSFFGNMLLAVSFSLVPLALQAQDLDALLLEAQDFRAEAGRLANERAATFRAAPAEEQERLTAEIDAARAEMQAAVQAMTDQYSENDLRIQDLNTQLRDKANELGLGELFGLARQFAADSTTDLEQSLINVQFAGSDRIEFLSNFAASDVAPTTAELERLAFEIQREMSAGGQVARFASNVVEPGGDLVETDVVRIGPFTAIADGQYLSYLPDLNRLSILPRQLPSEFMAAAENLQNATSGYVEGVVDPTSGVLMGLYVERPTWGERIHQGEEVGYIIIAVGILGFCAFFFQLAWLVYARLGVSRQMRNLDQPASNNALGRVLMAFKGNGAHIEEDAEVAELRISEAVMKEIPSLERFQAFLRLAVAAGPLLGLVGTVVGMIVTFQSITESGSSDPKLMAAGIGQAMIATVLGLGIAVPMLFGNAILNSLSRSIVQVLDEQSAGMLADNIEKRHHA